MNKIQYWRTLVNLKTREALNPVFAPIRRAQARLNINNPFTIISNNCWGGHVYRYFGIPYCSPTIGLYMFSEDYIKFIYNLKEYLSAPITFISLNESRYRNILISRGGDNVLCPIGKVLDVEIIFLHYKTQEEAAEKWVRRCQRVNFNNLFFKMSEQNICDEKLLKLFDSLPSDHKIVFTHKNYDLNSQIIFKSFKNSHEVLNDTNNFRKYINLKKWISGAAKYKLNQ